MAAMMTAYGSDDRKIPGKRGTYIVIEVVAEELYEVLLNEVARKTPSAVGYAKTEQEVAQLIRRRDRE